MESTGSVRQFYNFFLKCIVEMPESAMYIFKGVISHKWTKWQRGLSRMLLSTAGIIDSDVTCCKDVLLLLLLL